MENGEKWKQASEAERNSFASQIGVLYSLMHLIIVAACFALVTLL